MASKEITKNKVETVIEKKQGKNLHQFHC